MLELAVGLGEAGPLGEAVTTTGVGFLTTTQSNTSFFGAWTYT